MAKSHGPLGFSHGFFFRRPWQLGVLIFLKDACSGIIFADDFGGILTKQNGEMMSFVDGFYREIIPFCGRTIQVSELRLYSHEQIIVDDCMGLYYPSYIGNYFIIQGRGILN